MSTEKKALKEKIEKQKAFDNQKVTGKFINRRHPGKVSEKLLYQKYEDDPVKWYDFQARFLNIIKSFSPGKV